MQGRGRRKHLFRRVFAAASTATMNHQLDTTMSISFSSMPGAYERQLIRRHGNPMFPSALRTVDQVTLERAHERDARDAEDFIERFRALMEEAANLKPNTGSERILDLRQRVDMLYERACTIAGDRTTEKQALLRLFDAIDGTIRRGAANDPLALEELAEEAAARAAHLAMLEIPLVADLLRPDPPMDRDELAPTLLAADIAAFRTVIGLFDDAEKQELLLMMQRAVEDAVNTDTAGTNERLALLESEIARGERPLPS